MSGEKEIKRDDYFIVTDEILRKMWEGAEKEFDLLNKLCHKSTLAGKPVFGTEIRSFIKSLKEANKIEREAIQTFLRYGRVDCITKTGDPIRLNG